MKIHFNLGVAVGAADCIFIFEEFAQKERYSCVLVTILLYYTNMAVLSWMLIEGTIGGLPETNGKVSLLYR